MLFAAYESARTGRKAPLPFVSYERRPIDLWLPQLVAGNGTHLPESPGSGAIHVADMGLIATIKAHAELKAWLSVTFNDTS